jgi:protein-disulfide isomerase
MRRVARTVLSKAIGGEMTERWLAPDIVDRDHIRGALGAPMRLLIYGDYECPYTRKALISVLQVRGELGDGLIFAFRNFPLTEIHPHALHAALAAEAADFQGKFWEMHDLLFTRQRALADDDLAAHAAHLGLDGDRFRADFADKKGLARIEADIESGFRSGVEGTPSIFVNGKPYRDAYDPASLISALRSAVGSRARP